jgi:hypothetical protein
VSEGNSISITVLCPGRVNQPYFVHARGGIRSHTVQPQTESCTAVTHLKLSSLVLQVGIAVAMAATPSPAVQALVSRFNVGAGSEVFKAVVRELLVRITQLSADYPWII